MATKFFDRNKKKSLLGLILLWIKENRTLSALLLLVALSSFLFVAPAATLMNLPGGTKLVAGIAWVASRMGVDTSKWGFFVKGGARSYDDFIAALRQAKESGSRPVGWGPFFGKPAEGAGPSSLDMVKGRRQDLEGGGYPHGKLPEGKDVAGILTPEDSKDAESGVTIDDALLAQQRGGLVRDANAGGFAPGARDLLGFAGRADALNSAGMSVGAGAYAGKGMFGDGTGAGTRPGDNIRGALATTDPGSVPRGRIQGGTQGRLSQSRAAAMSARVQRGISARSVNSHRAFAQLADGRGRAAIATTPNCVPPGCPGEFATANTGAVYDGNRITGANTDILNAPEIDGTSPSIPDSSVADGYMRDAAQMEADAKKCRDLDEQYRDSENNAMAQMQAESDRFEQMGCGSGGCSKSKAKRCKAQGNRIKQACRDYARIRNEHTNACPLTAGKGQEMTCDDRGGPNDKGVQSQDGAHAVSQ
ncbi:MAG: hypothetical protein SF051_16300 [Elusimicrobiota bacterium]|nr:hypothetical protein [Elusimicrobiota bacterium]